MNINKQLAAIMFTDIVDYTALMGTNEDAAFKLLRKNREIQKLQISKCHGENMKEIGDGILASFHSASEAVKCAIDIQRKAKDEGIPLRIGIHEGEVLFEGGDVLGDTVNIASRIESFSNIGGVLISDTVREQVKNQADWDFVSLGKFYLKNVSRPYEISAVAAEGLIVPDRNLLQGKGKKIASFRTIIPIPPTPLLGREKEIDDLIGLLKENSIVTITGTGGIGKTRLALEICNRLGSEFQDGMAFVSMATITKATEVIPTLAVALDIKEAENRDLMKGVADLVSDKKAFIVLDNLEHVISAAKEISELASMCPNLKILNTSRSPLKIRSEKEYTLHTLLLPDKDGSLSVDELMNFPAIALFTDRAKEINIDFDLTSENASDVEKICRRMDGLPLALELAAARIRILSPKELVNRLEKALDVLTTGAQDIPERHQTLRAAINWSYSLLDKAQKQLFRRIAVFSGGFTLPGIEFICYDDEKAALSALDDLESLFDKGLVEKIDQGNRFNMLQTIIDFANEKLEEAGETNEIKFKHAQYYFEIAKNIKTGIENIEQLHWMEFGLQEDANIQAAFDYLLERAKSGDDDARELGLRICGELYLYWHIRGKHISAKVNIDSFLNISKSLKSSLGECRALITASLATWALQKFEQAAKEGSTAYSIAKKLNAELELAESTLMLGLIYVTLDSDMAIKYSKEGEERCRKLGNIPSILGFTLWVQGLALSNQGHMEEAKNKFTEALDIQLEIGDREGGGCSLSGLANLKIIEGNLKEAIELYKRTLASFEAVKDRPEEARISGEMAWTYLKLDNTLSARKYILNSIKAHQKVGSDRGIGMAMIGLAAIESVENRYETAIQIATAAEHFLNQEGIVYEYGEDFSYNEYIENAKKGLSKPEIERATKEGRKLTLNEVLQLFEGYTLVED